MKTQAEKSLEAIEKKLKSKGYEPSHNQYGMWYKAHCPTFLIIRYTDHKSKLVGCDVYKAVDTKNSLTDTLLAIEESDVTL